jgi:hypothetical protein
MWEPNTDLKFIILMPNSLKKLRLLLSELIIQKIEKKLLSQNCLWAKNLVAAKNIIKITYKNIRTATLAIFLAILNFNFSLNF